jgi:phosphonoacetaldehyde hydrolase
MWHERHGRAPTDADVQAMYDDFLPLQKRVLAEGAEMIAGVVDAMATLRDRGIRIGSTTGYTRELMSVVTPLAAEQGYVPDSLVCSDEVPAGRPAPWMNFLAAQQLGVYPMSQIVAVDDTPVGIEAAKNAGCIAVGVSTTGNAMGLSPGEFSALEPVERSRRVARIESQFRAAGADFVIDSVADLPQLIDQLTRGDVSQPTLGRSQYNLARMALLPEKIDAVVFDFDGVFTDNRVWVTEDGRESAACDRSDGLGIGLLKKTGLPMLVLSKERVPIVARRCEKLGLECLHGVDDKITLLSDWLAERQLSMANTIYMGNDVNDRDCLLAAGCGVSPSDGHPDILPLANLVLDKPGGHGAVRQLCDLVLHKLQQA